MKCKIASIRIQGYIYPRLYCNTQFCYGLYKNQANIIFLNDLFMAGTVHAEDASTATLLGMRTRAYKFQPVSDIKNITNFELRF